MPAAQQHECVACGAALALFQPTCPSCDTKQVWRYNGPCPDCGDKADYLAGDCENCGTSLSIWRALEAKVSVDEEPLLLWRAAVPRPTEQGYRRHLGSIYGQWADYRRTVDDGGDFHIRRFLRYYELHYDDVSAVDSPTRHLLRHGPSAAVGSGLALTRQVTGAVAQSGRLAGRTALAPYDWLRSVGEQADAEAD
jgi:hypothetical protein